MLFVVETHIRNFATINVLDAIRRIPGSRTCVEYR